MLSNRNLKHATAILTNKMIYDKLMYIDRIIKHCLIIADGMNSILSTLTVLVACMFIIIYRPACLYSTQ